MLHWFLQTSLSLPGSPYTIRRINSNGSHQFPWRATNGRRAGDKKRLVSTYLDAQEHLPYADDSAAVTPMSEENGAIIVPVYTSLGSRHDSYTSHTSRVSYVSHNDLMNGNQMTKASQLARRLRSGNPEVIIDSLDDNQCVSSEAFRSMHEKTLPIVCLLLLHPANTAGLPPAVVSLSLCDMYRSFFHVGFFYYSNSSSFSSYVQFHHIETQTQNSITCRTHLYFHCRWHLLYYSYVHLKRIGYDVFQPPVSVPLPI